MDALPWDPMAGHWQGPCTLYRGTSRPLPPVPQDHQGAAVHNSQSLPLAVRRWATAGGQGIRVAERQGVCAHPQVVLGCRVVDIRYDEHRAARERELLLLPGHRLVLVGRRTVTKQLSARENPRVEGNMTLGL